MNRRSYLRSLAVTATALSPVLAGCNENDISGGDEAGGGGGGDDDGGGESTETATQTPEERAETHIKEAVGALNKVGFKLQELEDQLQEDPSSVEFDVEATRAMVESARSDLDAAADLATAEQTKDVQALRHLATIIAAMANAVETLQSTDPNARLEEIQSTIENEEYETALTMLRESKETLQTTADHVDEALAAAAEVDGERLKALNAVELSQVRPPLETIDRQVDAFITLATGFEQMLLGREDLAAAEAHLENKEAAAAEEDLQKAKTHFTSSQSTFDSMGSDAPEDISGHLERARCQAGHLVAATEHFQQAAEAFQDNDPLTASQERDAGKADLQKVNDC
ncbi:hypothetical protein [Haloarchaeobius amylolyticus]|uniref:hypothetical protein n=1 Tax=Haloarchaeobius amylolyticus TaxID=1198296 RepID=UPI00227190F0|nr:hypothetical protein [Haloarchaeobius amylolyticus]